MSLPYRLYGVAVETSLSFTFNVPRTAEAPTLRVVAAPAPFPSSLWNSMTAVHREAGDGVSIPSTLLRHPDGRCWGLRFEGVTDFFLTPGAIGYHLADPALAYALEIWLLGTVFSLWSELQGRPALHAAAVAVEGHTIGFLATNKGGKSSLVATLMQKGYPLLTDDILMLDHSDQGVFGLPSYPQMRMWPDQATHFLGAEAAEALPLVVPHLSKRRLPVGPDGFGTFHDAPCPVAALILPERREDDASVELQRVPPGEALIELIRHSFLPNTVDHLGLAPRRLPVMAALAQQAPMYRLRYPDGVEHLPRVADALLARLMPQSRQSHLESATRLRTR